jgi:hypothetical protein
MDEHAQAEEAARALEAEEPEDQLGDAARGKDQDDGFVNQDVGI